MKTKGPNGVTYEWRLKTDKTLRARPVGYSRWILAAKNITDWDVASDFIFGYCGHKEVSNDQ